MLGFVSGDDPFATGVFRVFNAFKNTKMEIPMIRER